MLRALDDLVEQRIRDAQRDGQFDDLPGAGKPLQLDDDPLVPVEVRVAFRVLKNAGCVPSQVAALRDLDALVEQLLAEAQAQGESTDDRPAHQRRSRRLLALTLELERHGLRHTTQDALARRRALSARAGKTNEQQRGEQ